MPQLAEARSLVLLAGLETVRSHSMIATRTGAVIVYVHTADAPSDVEWDQAMRFFEAPDLRHLRVLVYTDGAAPNVSQRARLNGLLGSNKLPMAVLTPSVLARAAGTAISWFNPNLRVYGPDDYEAAFKQLNASADERTALRTLVERFKAELGVRRAVAGQARP